MSNVQDMMNKKVSSLFLLIIFSLILHISFWSSPTDTYAAQQKMIYYIVDSDALDNLQAEITQFISDVSQGTGSQSTIITSTQETTSGEIRNILKNGFNNDNLWGAFLIGKVPQAYIQYPGNDALLSDEPYRAFDCPYTDEDNDGIFQSASNFSIIPACMPSIWLSRIYPSREGSEGIDQIKTYLTKNHLLRNDLSHFNQKMFYHSSVGIGEEGKTYDDFVNAFTEFFADNPLYSIDDITISYDTDPTVLKNNFLNAFESNYEVIKILNHGAPTFIEFRGTTSLIVDSYSSELAARTSHVKFIDLDSCSTGHFLETGYFAGEALFSGDTLLVMANPEPVGIFSNGLQQDIQTSYYGLGLGLSFSDLYTNIGLGQPRHFFGDPTISFRQKNLIAPPKLNINGESITEPTKYKLEMGNAFNDQKTKVTLNFSNHGDSPLKIHGQWIPYLFSYNKTSHPDSTTGMIFSILDQSYSDFNFEKIIQPGSSENLEFQFDPNANDDKPGSAEYDGVFIFMTNDPKVGSFQILSHGKHIVSDDTDNDGLPDAFEIAYFGNLDRDGTGDYDNDKVSDLDEYKNGTNPTTSADADSDGMPDDWEIKYFGETSQNGTSDYDSDGYTNLAEYENGTDPTVITDTKNDGSGDTGGSDTGDGDTGGSDTGSSDTGSSGSGGGGIFGAISLKDVIGYHLDGVRSDGVRVYMPVTKGFKALKGAQTQIERFAPGLAKLIRRGFESLERIAEANKGGLLYKAGTHLFPLLGKIAELYLEAVNSKELMTNAYSSTTISVSEFNKLHQQGIALAPHVVRDEDNEGKLCRSSHSQKGTEGLYSFYKKRLQGEKKFYDFMPPLVEKKYLKTIYQCFSRCADCLNNEDMDKDGEMTVLDIDYALRSFGRL
jgi:hypothetical protein